MFDGFASRLYASPLSTFLRSETWIIPASQSVHILCVAIVIAAAAMLSARLCGWIATDQPIANYGRTRTAWIFGAFAILLLTGIIQTVAEPTREFSNILFLTKMALAAIAIVFTAALYIRLNQGPLSRVWRACGIGLIILWALIVVCGRWIAYI